MTGARFEILIGGQISAPGKYQYVALLWTLMKAKSFLDKIKIFCYTLKLEQLPYDKTVIINGKKAKYSTLS